MFMHVCGILWSLNWIRNCIEPHPAHHIRTKIEFLIWLYSSYTYMHKDHRIFWNKYLKGLLKFINFLIIKFALKDFSIVYTNLFKTHLRIERIILPKIIISQLRCLIILYYVGIPPEWILLLSHKPSIFSIG